MPLEADKIIDGVNDSKKLTPEKRRKLYEKIIKTAIDYSICSIDENVIDQINILEATKLSMQNCLKDIKVKPDYCLVDYVPNLQLECDFQTIVKGDAKSYSIACASILAKVARDNYMVKLSSDFPEYQFDKHKGYGTKLHYELIEKYGISPVHRKTFLKSKGENSGNNQIDKIAK